MTAEDSDAWNVVAFGHSSPEERGAFYDALADDNKAAQFGFFDDDERYYANPSLEAAILQSDGRIVPAALYPRPAAFSASTVNLFLERYFVHAMPGSNFDLQLAISVRHNFTGKRIERVSHTMAVKGVKEHYVNYLTEPIFQELAINDVLALDIAVTFVSDRSTERLLNVLKSPELNKGIKLASTYNPVFGTVATYVRGLVETVATARKNQVITDAHIGLLAAPGEISLPLIDGTYVFYQPLSTSDNIMNENPRFDLAQQRVVTDGGSFNRNHFFMRIEANN